MVIYRRVIVTQTRYIRADQGVDRKPDAQRLEGLWKAATEKNLLDRSSEGIVRMFMTLAGKYCK